MEQSLGVRVPSSAPIKHPQAIQLLKNTFSSNERALTSIWPELVRILLVSMFLVNMGAIGDWIGDIVTDIEQATVLNGNPMQAFVTAINQKFGVDLSALVSPMTPGGVTNTTGTLAGNGATVSTYGYEQPGDPTYDSKSAQGIVAFPFDSAPGSLRSGDLAISPSLSAGLTPGQQAAVTLANGQTITGRYADQTAASYNGQTLYRVDVYDPTHQLDSLSGVGVTNINGVAPTQNNANLGDWFNAMVHPAETAQIAFFGMFTLALSYVAAFIMWLAALLQSILYYSEIALAPLFVGCIMVRGLENIAKSFLLSFVAISMWRIAFLVSGLITQFLIGLAVNSGNIGTAGAANAAGMTYLWMICTAIWIVFSSIAGPWWISRRVVSGASGMADMLVGAHLAAGRVYHIGANAAGGLNGGSGTFISSASLSRMNGFTPNYARRPINGAAQEETNG